MAIPINKSTSLLDNNKDKKIGLKFPLSNSNDGYFDYTDLTVDAVKENIRNLIQTRKGERLFQPELGIGLQELLFENIDNDTKVMIEEDIKNTLKRWLPFVIPQNISIEENMNTTGISNSLHINVEFGMTYSPNMSDSVEIVIE